MHYSLNEDIVEVNIVVSIVVILRVCEITTISQQTVIYIFKHIKDTFFKECLLY